MENPERGSYNSNHFDDGDHHETAAIAAAADDDHHDDYEEGVSLLKATSSNGNPASFLQRNNGSRNSFKSFLWIWLATVVVCFSMGYLLARPTTNSSTPVTTTTTTTNNNNNNLPAPPSEPISTPLVPTESDVPSNNVESHTDEVAEPVTTKEEIIDVDNQFPDEIAAEEAGEEIDPDEEIETQGETFPNEEEIHPQVSDEIATEPPTPPPAAAAVEEIIETSPPTASPIAAPSLPPVAAEAAAAAVIQSPPPTFSPTGKPTLMPTMRPTPSPTMGPTLAPTLRPTLAPTLAPTLRPTFAPTLAPTMRPTFAPTLAPTLRPTLAPTLAPTAAPVSSRPTSIYLSQDDPTYFPHLPFGNNQLQYRRVCAPVHSSILCITLRFPFGVKPQDPKFSYARPVDDRFYGMEQKAYIVENSDLLHCETEFGTNSTLSTTFGALASDDAVRKCLDWYTAKQADPSKVMAVVWTRRRMDSNETTFYGTHQRPEQGKAFDKFFDKHLILIMGASPTPGIGMCMADLFGGCGGGGMKPYSLLCTGHDVHRELGNTNRYATLPTNKTFFGVVGFYPGDSQHGRHHYLPDYNITSWMKGNDFTREPGFKELRKISFIIEYPLAHVQNQNMIYEEWDNVAKIQDGFPKLIMEAATPAGKKELAAMGYQLGHIIAYDGLPQFNPSDTGAYDWSQHSIMSEDEFKANPPIGWVKEHGTSCRGPVPPTSKLTQVNRLSRYAFEKYGLDMHYYGRTWEFANQFWFHITMWAGKGLDCTHSRTSSGCVHKYFLLAMAEDEMEKRK